MDLFDLFCKISIDTGDTNTKIDSVSQKMQTAKKSLENVGTAVKNAGKTFATIGTGVMAAGTAVFAFTNKVTQNGDAIDKNSQKLGISAEAYQEWDFIMQHCGSTIEGLKPSMKTLANAAADGNDSTAAAFNKLGLSIDEVSAMSQEDLFATVIERLQEMGEGTERTAIASDLLGRAAIDLGPVLNMSAEETEALRQQVHELGGVMSNEAVANSAAFQDSLYNVKVAFGGAANSLAEELIPNITSLMDKVSAFVADGGIQKIIDGFERMVPVITGAVAAIVTFKTVSAISGVVSALTKAIDGQAFSFKALAAAMNTNPFVLIVTAIAAVVTALVTLWNTNEGFRNAVQNIWASITGFFTGALDSIKAAWGNVSEWFSERWEGIKNAFSSAGEWFSSLFTAAWDGVKAAWASTVEFFTGIWEGIKTAFSVAASVLTGFFQAAWDGVKAVWNVVVGFFQNVWNGIKNTFSVVSSVITGFFSAAWNGVKFVWDSVIAFFQRVWNGIKLTFSVVKSVLTGDFSGAWEGIKNVFSGVRSFFNDVWNNIKSVFSNAGSHFLGIGKNIVQGIWDGISGMVSWFTSKVKNFFSGIVNGVKNMLGIHSPSKVFAGIGGFMAEGLGEGWDDAYSKIERDINKDLDFSGNITTSGSYNGYGKSYGTALLGATFNITVNGANIQDDQSLAERIAFEIQQMVDRKEAVFGAA